MRRRKFITLLGGAVLALPMRARAQQKRIPRLCFLTFDPGTLRTRSPRFDGFFQGLQELGYVNARNIEISYLLQKMEQYDGLAILATNLHDNFDTAFARRLSFTVYFPFPDEDSRRRIWQRIWPARTHSRAPGSRGTRRL